MENNAFFNPMRTKQIFANYTTQDFKEIKQFIQASYKVINQKIFEHVTITYSRYSQHRKLNNFKNIKKNSNRYRH